MKKRSNEKGRRILGGFGIATAQVSIPSNSRQGNHKREKSFDLSHRSIHLFSERSLLNKTTIGMKNMDDTRNMIVTSIDNDQTSTLGGNSIVNFVNQPKDGKTIILSKNNHYL